MTIEKFEEIPAYFEANKDNEQIKAFLTGLSKPTLEGIQKFVADDEKAKGWLDSEKDKHLNKGLETWKSNNLQKSIDDEIKKRFPEADPKDTEIAKLKADFEKMQKDALTKDLTNKALKTITEKKLPADLVDYFVGQDEDSTNKNLEKFITAMAAHDEAIKTELLKDNSYTPPGGGGGVGGDEKMRAEISKYFK